MQEPTATLDSIIAALNLAVSTSTLHHYLTQMDWPRQSVKRQILLSETNRIKRIAFRKDMMQKGRDYYERNIWTDKTMIIAHPNGEVVFFRSLKGSSPFIQELGWGDVLGQHVKICLRSSSSM